MNNKQDLMTAEDQSLAKIQHSTLAGLNNKTGHPGTSFAYFPANRQTMIRSFIISLFAIFLYTGAQSQAIIAYYAGDAKSIDQYPVGQLTHIIFSFCYLKGDRLHVGRQSDSMTIKKLVTLKQANPALKVLLSLGGWGGCRTCSEVFATARGRTAFARSVQELTSYFHTDGIDLDWEYPTLGGYPGHPFSPSDKDSFTSLLQALRQALGPSKEISFIIAGFAPYLQGSIDLVNAARIADRINLMTYDMIGSRSRITGHHTPLYSTSRQQESVDNAVRYLDSLGVPRNKIAIGAAFYARSFAHVPDKDHGLYQPGTFRQFLSMRQLRSRYTPAHGYQEYWDDEAQAPYRYNAARKIYLTYDNERSIAGKAAYVKEKGLNGIMFWELRLDIPYNGLLSAISQNFPKTPREPWKPHRSCTILGYDPCQRLAF